MYDYTHFLHFILLKLDFLENCAFSPSLATSAPLSDFSYQTTHITAPLRTFHNLYPSHSSEFSSPSPCHILFYNPTYPHIHHMITLQTFFSFYPSQQSFFLTSSPHSPCNTQHLPIEQISPPTLASPFNLSYFFQYTITFPTLSSLSSPHRHTLLFFLIPLLVFSHSPHTPCANFPLLTQIT